MSSSTTKSYHFLEMPTLLLNTINWNDDIIVDDDEVIWKKEIKGE
jgi:hypothetical protein